MIFRTIVFFVLTVPMWVALALYDTAVQPQASTDLAIRAVNGTNQDAENLRVGQRVMYWPNYVGAGWTVLAGAACFAGPIKRTIKEMK
jgi:hypothetical protein